MIYGLYNTALALIAPCGAIWLRCHPRHRTLLARFNPSVPPLHGRPLWVHACSVGEVNTARPIVKALQARLPKVPMLLTVSTETGHVLAEKVCAEFAVTWSPFDTRAAVRRFLDKAQPRALVIVETELWPNLVRETRRRGVPVIVVNGRISDKHYPRYRRWRSFFAEVLRHVTAIGAQNDAYAQRFAAIGAAPGITHVTGNTKFDGVTTGIDAKARSRLRTENGFQPGQPILIFGSTRPGDEALAAACWRALCKDLPGLRLIVAPRHLERLPEAVAAFSEPILRRSEVKEGRSPDGERVFLLDTVGELVSFYAIASVAVVGGSFYPGVNGHNPLEPAALGVPTVFGPYMSNFTDPARALLAARGAIQVSRPEDLCAALRSLLADPAEQRQLGTRARKAVLDNQGAIDRNVDLVLAQLDLST